MPFKGKPHELTREDRAKGGSQNTPTKRMANSIRMRKYCRQDCPLFPCPLQPLSEKNKGRCALKKASLKLQQRTVNLFLKGRTGAIHELTKIIYEIAEKADKDGSLRAKGEYFDKLVKLIETAYGKVIKQEFDEPVEIRVRWAGEKEATG